MGEKVREGGEAFVDQSRGKSQILQFPSYAKNLLNCSLSFPDIHFQLYLLGL